MMLRKEPKAKSTGTAPGLIESSSQSSGGSIEAVHGRKVQRSPVYYTSASSNVQEIPVAGSSVKSPSVKKSSPSNSSKRSSRPASSSAVPETNKRMSFLVRTVQDLQNAFNSLQVWATGSSSHDDGTANNLHNAPSLNDILLAPCKCYTEVVERQKTQEQEDQFLFAEWKANGPSRKREPKQQQQQQQQQQPRLSWILSKCAAETFSCHQKTLDLVDQLMRLDQGGSMDDNTLGDYVSIVDSEEEDEMQMRRLTSWGTIGTEGSIGTCESSASLTTETERGGSPCLDDDGNPINPVLLEKTIAASQKRRPKRKRLVKFDYPPVSSFRQCERIDQEDVDKLFFTEEELDQYEEDRYETAVADDVEVVAIAPSLEEERRVVTNVAKATGTPTKDNNNKFSSAYIPTPRIKDGVRRSRRPATPGRNHIPSAARTTERRGAIHVGAEADKKHASPAHHQHQLQQQRDHHESIPSSSSALKSPRLVKSVQIFLRERSTGSRPEQH